jgi:hypothetical protein
MPHVDPSLYKSAAVGTQQVAKVRDSADAANTVQVGTLLRCIRSWPSPRPTAGSGSPCIHHTLPKARACAGACDCLNGLGLLIYTSAFSIACMEMPQPSCCHAEPLARCSECAKVYLIDVRVPEHHTDILITLNTPTFINPDSTAASQTGGGFLQAPESANVLFGRILNSFQIRDLSFLSTQ